MIARWIAVAVLFCSVGCGYTLGPSPRVGVRSIHVPVVQSDSFRRDVDYLLTEAIQQEIKVRTGYQLAEEATADTILRCRIIDTRKNTLSETRFDDPREVQLLLGAQVTWLDRRTGQVLQKQTFALPQQFSQHSSQVSFAPEAGHSLATAQQDATRQLAAQIVDLTEMPW